MAEKKVIEIDIETNVSSLKTQLREAQAEVAKLADKFGATSKEATEAAKRAAELKDRIGDAKALTDAFNPDAKFNALSASIGGVLNGFQAYEGALGLIGVESEQVQATLLKVQSAMALSQGLQGIGEARDSFIQLGATIKNTALFTSAYNFVMGVSNKVTAENVAVTEADTASKVGLTGATGTLSLVTGGATTAMKLFRVALIATGIGAIVVLIGLLIANFDKVTQVVQKLSGYVIKAYDYFDNLGTSIKVLVGIFFPFIGVVYGAIKALEYFNVIDTKTERDMSVRHIANMKRIDKSLEKQEQQRKAKEKAYNEEDKALGRQIALLEAQGKSSDALVEKRLKNSIKYQKALLEELQLNQRILRATNFSGVNDDLINENSKAIIDTIESIKDARNQLLLNDIENNKKKVDNTKKTNEELFIIDDSELKRREAQRKMDAENLALYLGDMTMLKTNSALEELTKYKEVRDKELEIDKATAEKKKALEQDVKRAKIQIAVDTLNLIQNVAELFGRNDEKRAKQAFNIDKVAKISSAIMSGIEGTINAYKTAQSSPITAVFPAYPAIQAGLAGAFAATNIAKLSATKFGATSNGGNTSSTSGGGQTFTPSFNVVGNSGINQLATLQQQPVKAYITAGEVSSALSLERNTLQKTTF